MRTNRPLSMTGFFMIVLSLATLTCQSFGASLSGGQTLFICEASYYTRASCVKESGQCKMANGKELNDEALTAASWDFDFGTKLRIKCNGRQVVVCVTDRGPSKRLYKRGRRIDLSLAAARALHIIKSGVAVITVERVGGPC